MVYSRENWPETIQAMHSGDVIEIGQEIYDYFLEVLPPVYMGRKAKVIDGQDHYVDFGFAEGAEPITAFWSLSGPRYFCQRTAEMNR